jgi:hypothetical protein
VLRNLICTRQRPVLAGRAAGNGWVMWKTSGGKLLSDVYEAISAEESADESYLIPSSKDAGERAKPVRRPNLARITDGGIRGTPPPRRQPASPLTDAPPHPRVQDHDGAPNGA